MKLKKYDRFLKEDLTPVSIGSKIKSPTKETELHSNVHNTPSNPQLELEEGEEELDKDIQFSGEQLMMELKNRLEENTDNLPGEVKFEENAIVYSKNPGDLTQDKKIEFYSETNAFAINRKGKYKTVDEVIQQLKK